MPVAMLGRDSHLIELQPSSRAAENPRHQRARTNSSSAGTTGSASWMTLPLAGRCFGLSCFPMTSILFFRECFFTCIHCAPWFESLIARGVWVKSCSFGEAAQVEVDGGSGWRSGVLLFFSQRVENALGLAYTAGLNDVRLYLI